MKRVIIAIFLTLLLIITIFGCNNNTSNIGNTVYQNDKYKFSFDYLDGYGVIEDMYPENRGLTLYLYNEHFDIVTSPNSEQIIAEIDKLIEKGEAVRVFVWPPSENDGYDSYELFYYCVVTGCHEEYTLVNTKDLIIDRIPAKEFTYTFQVTDPENSAVKVTWKKTITAFLDTYHGSEMVDCTTYKIIYQAPESVYSDTLYSTILDTFKFY